MKKILGWLAALTCSLQLGVANALVIGFEDYAPPGGSTQVTTTSHYLEAGFTITPSTNTSRVFDSATGTTMIGNNTDWFGFAENNIPSLTLTSGVGAFDLVSALIGPSTRADIANITMTISGVLADSSIITATFTGLTTATTVNLGWKNLTSVSFRTTDDAGLDDIVVNQVPLPTTVGLVGLALAAMRFGRRNLNASR